MKLFVLFAVAALVVGGIYHTEVSQYFNQLAEESSDSDYGGGASVVNSMRGMGNSSNALIGGAAGALNQ